MDRKLSAYDDAINAGGLVHAAQEVKGYDANRPWRAVAHAATDGVVQGHAHVSAAHRQAIPMLQEDTLTRHGRRMDRDR